MEIQKFTPVAGDGTQVFYAVRLSSENAQEAAEWCSGLFVIESNPLDPGDTYAAVNVPCFPGMVRASDGDYIYQGPSGSFYVKKPGQFNRVFDPYASAGDIIQKEDSGPARAVDPASFKQVYKPIED